MADAETQSSQQPIDTLINKDEGRQYWQGVEADNEGMLGGLGFVSRLDLQGSRMFLAKLGIGRRNGLRTVKTALEGGAGIGRITEGLLANISEHVDVIEPTAKFAAKLEGKPKVRDIFTMGLEEWDPARSKRRSGVDKDSNLDGRGGAGGEEKERGEGEERGKVEEGEEEDDGLYDLIWTQWCVGHLTDHQLVEYLKRCKTVLRPQVGIMVVKENITNSNEDEFDQQDSSVTRGHAKFASIFAQAGLRVTRTELQKGFPAECFPVKSWALKPCE